MAYCRSDVKTLIYLTFSLHLSLAVTHTLQYFYTAVTGIDFPEYTLVGQVDGEQFVYYDSNIRKIIPKTQWIQKNVGEDYWSKETHKCQYIQDIYKVHVASVMQHFNQTNGVHTVQVMYGCEFEDDDDADDSTTRGYRQDSYDGEDYISLDLNSVTWTAAKPQAVFTKQMWDNNPVMTVGRKYYLEKECIEWLKNYVSYGRDVLERKVPPTASVFQKHSAPPEVVCHATGFFPRTLMISWQKDGQDIHENVDLSETLPNQDGSFQKRSILKVSAEELQKHTYTCVIEHSSLEKEMVLKVPKEEGLTGFIIGIIVALVVLAAVVAGIVVWKKKKNSGFKPVPARASSEGDSSFSNTCV